MGLGFDVLKLVVDGTQGAVATLAATTGATPRNVTKAAQRLKAKGLLNLERPAPDDRVYHGAKPRYVATEAGRALVETGQAVVPGAKVRQRKRTVGLRERAWWHLRNRKTATLTELLMTHADGSEKAAHMNLYKWLVALEKAGVLAQGRRIQAKQGRGSVQWQLVKDLGREAPVWRQRQGVVYDPNSDTVMPFKKEGEGNE